jgi:hypothetical protein
MSGILGALASGAAPRIAVSNVTITSNTTDPVSASAQYTLNATGDIERFTTLGGTVDIGDWISPKSALKSPYTVRATVTSGALSSGTTGSDLALTGSQTWAVNQVGLGNNSATFTVDIKRGSTILATASITLNANVSP